MCGYGWHIEKYYALIAGYNRREGEEEYLSNWWHRWHKSCPNAGV